MSFFVRWLMSISQIQAVKDETYSAEEHRKKLQEDLLQMRYQNHSNVFRV